MPAEAGADSGDDLPWLLPPHDSGEPPATSPDQRAESPAEREGGSRGEWQPGSGLPGGSVWPAETEAVRAAQEPFEWDHSNSFGADPETPPGREAFEEGEEFTRAETPGGPEEAVGGYQEVLYRDDLSDDAPTPSEHGDRDDSSGADRDSVEPRAWGDPSGLTLGEDSGGPAGGSEWPSAYSEPEAWDDGTGSVASPSEAAGWGERSDAPGAPREPRPWDDPSELALGEDAGVPTGGHESAGAYSGLDDWSDVPGAAGETPEAESWSDPGASGEGSLTHGSEFEDAGLSGPMPEARAWREAADIEPGGAGAEPWLDQADAVLGEPDPRDELPLIGLESYAAMSPADPLTPPIARPALPVDAPHARRVEEVASRLERIARALREKGPAGPLAEQGSDALSALITGYLLGFSDSDSQREPPPSG